MDKVVKVKKNRALPVKAVLTFEDGSLVTDLDLTALPAIQVLYTAVGEDANDVTEFALPAGMGTEGNEFVYNGDGEWQFNLKTSNYTAAGSYEITILSGDDSEYVIEPACSAIFVIE
jgi:hypothetical protein